MRNGMETVGRLRDWWKATSSPDSSADYRIVGELGSTSIAIAQGGGAAVVVPMPTFDAEPIGRRASGFELVGHSCAHFVWDGRERTTPAAALVCTDSNLVETFAVLAADIAEKASHEALTWSAMVAIIEEWQALFAPRGVPSAERQLGLWGELWFVSAASDVDRMLAAWRGPEGDSTDFFVEGVGAEVKTSRQRRVHMVSQVQVADAVVDGWLVSLWVKKDPSGGLSVPMLVERILERSHDCPSALRAIARAGYSPIESSSYDMKVVLLTEPEWYPFAVVPRVRAADAGVSRLRYQVTLPELACASAADASKMRQHFHGSKHEGPAR